MSKHKILAALILALGLSCCANAELVGWWKLDETEGTVAWDSSGNERHGEVTGGTTWIPDGRFGGALEFDGVGTAGTNVSLPISQLLNELTNSTFTIWANFHQTGGAWQRLWDFGDGTANGYMFLCPRIGTGATGTLRYAITLTSNGSEQQLNAPFTLPTDWHHVAIVLNGDEGNMIMYVDGEVIDEKPTTIFPANLPLTTQNWLGQSQWPDGIYDGALDDFRIYDQALTAEDIAVVMISAGADYPFASNPIPANGALHADTWVTLSWRAGDYAVSHDVYLGDNFDDVSNGTKDSEVFRGNQVATFYVAGFPGFAYPEGLVHGMTYYWRIDEVNDANVASPWKGDVWSFSIPPKTAYNPVPANGAEAVGPDNVTLRWTAGYGAKIHTVYFGDDFDTVSNATGGAPSGVTSYNVGTLKREKVYYWRIDEFDGVATHKGNVWSFTTPGAVGNPQPAFGATDVQMNVILHWTPADSAASHQLYFGTDKETVRNAGPGAPEDKGSKALGAESHDPGLLEPNTEYSWRVDEVDTQGNTTKGPLWIFTTGAFLVVDDFEGYTNDDTAGEAIWQTWIDGFGVPDNGAQVGYLIPPYAEQTIVHGGLQSMPLLYVNETGVTNSETSMTLTAPRDWTEGGVAELSLWYRGASANAADPLYVVVSNSTGTPTIVVNGNAAAATNRKWTEWRIPLQAFADKGINLTNVDKIAIGLGSKSGMASAGGSGQMFFDDIRLIK